jgi:hypothetical protein
MAESEERMRILKMVEEHKITAEEAAKLLVAVGDGGSTAADQRPGRGAQAGKWLRIRVTDITTGRSKASVQIPLGLLDAGMKIGAHFAPEVEGVDMSIVLDAVHSGVTGKIIDVTDDKDGEHVEIFVE